MYAKFYRNPTHFWTQLEHTFRQTDKNTNYYIWGIKILNYQRTLTDLHKSIHLTVFQLKEETAALKAQVQDLLQGIDDSIEKTKDGELKDMLKQCRKEISSSSGALFKGVAGNPNDKVFN